jgi:hypothetical protein
MVVEVVEFRDSQNFEFKWSGIVGREWWIHMQDNTSGIEKCKCYFKYFSNAVQMDSSLSILTMVAAIRGHPSTCCVPLTA